MLLLYLVFVQNSELVCIDLSDVWLMRDICCLPYENDLKMSGWKK